MSNKSLDLVRDTEEKSYSILRSTIDLLPESLQNDINKTLELIKDNKTVATLYKTELVETPFSQSSFQDICVQFEIHFTPHRKLRQALLELDNRLRALYEAKDNFAKSYLKYEKIQLQIKKIEEEIENDNLSEIDKELKMIKLKELYYDKAKLERDLESISNLVKDALIKVVQYQNLVDQFRKEVEETDLSFEEAEMVYYVMYFTKDAEVQLRTMGRVDTGTFGAIAQLPEPLRKKVLNNIEFIRRKLADGELDDYIYIKYWNEMLPEIKDGKVEGIDIKELIKYEPPKILAAKNPE